MDGPDPAPWFVGDLEDRWVAGIADALPPGTVRIACADDLPTPWPAGLAGARTLVLHRAVLTQADFERIRRLRAVADSPRLVLCVGPNARYRDAQVWAALVDVVVPEATARETIARTLAGGDPRSRPAGPRPRVAVVSGLFDLRQMLADSCKAAGYPADPAPDWSAVATGGLAVWDVPVLDADWPARLAIQARQRKVVALLGFADREMVTLARDAGAVACLDLPCDPADLTFVLDRLAAESVRPNDPPHVVPPMPTGARRARRGREGRADPLGSIVAETDRGA